jgi:choice-of-anchor A domain-containing protein
MTQTQSDVEGRLAVGRNASFEDFLIGSKIVPDAARVDLVVGGNLTLNRGEVRSGKTYYGGVATTEFAIFFGGLEQQPGYFPFDRVRSWSRLLTSTLARYPDNGDVQVTGSGPTYAFSLTGTQSRLNVFNLSADEMATVDTLNISVPSGSTVLINVTGIDVTMRAFGFNLTGTTANKVLFNMPEASRLQMDAIGVLGSILAPSADVTFNNGAVDGFVVANSMGGTGEFHWVPFDGCLPWGAYYHRSKNQPTDRPVLSPE